MGEGGKRKDESGGKRRRPEGGQGCSEVPVRSEVMEGVVEQQYALNPFRSGIICVPVVVGLSVCLSVSSLAPVALHSS